MARIGEAELERLKASVLVADLVAADGVVLARSGADLAGLSVPCGPGAIADTRIS
jgi:hypothetical protein